MTKYREIIQLRILGFSQHNIMANCGVSQKMNNPVSMSPLSGDRKPQIRFLGNHHSGSGNLYYKSFRM